MPYYLERFDESVRRNRADWKLPLLPSEYFHRNVSVVYIVDEMGARQPLRHRREEHHVGPRLPALVEQLARRLPARPSRSWSVSGATESEIERIMWRNAADMYKLPYDEPANVAAAA